VDLQNNLSFVTNPSNGNISYSTSFFNIIVKTNFSAIEATKRALEKSVVSPGEYPSHHYNQKVLKEVKVVILNLIALIWLIH